MKREAVALWFFMILHSAGGLPVKGQEHSGFWFDEMYAANTTSLPDNWGKYLFQMWDSLRGRYPGHEQLLQMSWEERDGIWNAPLNAKELHVLAGRYRKGFLVSCNERGVQPVSIDTTVSTIEDVKRIRNIYLESRKAEYIILTPDAPKEPVINGSAVYGIRPGNPLLYRISATGERPMIFSVEGMPAGCTYDSITGILSGIIKQAGEYTLTIRAKNNYGAAGKKLLLKAGRQIALTPPLGWNSWNAFACNVTDRDIRNAADQLIRTGLADRGWSYVNIDDCWMKMPDMQKLSTPDQAMRKPYYNLRFKQVMNSRFNEQEVTGPGRNEAGKILPNRDFPDMKALTGYIHSLGLKAGIYISPGPLTCQCYEGSYGHESKDAQTFADWGFDYLKYDWCAYGIISSGKTRRTASAPYKVMGNALKEVNRDIVYSLCQYGNKEVWKWGGKLGGNSWRTTQDITDSWEIMSGIGFSQSGLESYAAPGHWNDPDMLVVGYVGWSMNLRPTLLSPNEQYTHITLWSMLAAPLLIGCDLSRLDDFTYGLLSNTEVLAVNQDQLGKQASRVIIDGNIQVWTKPLFDGSMAVAAFNLGEEPVAYTLSFESLGLHGPYYVRDLWRQKTSEKERSISFTLNRHATILLRVEKRKK